MLTRAEARVAVLVAEALSVAEIASAVGVSVYTVRAHVRSIYRKAGVNRQAALVHLVLHLEA
jgi:DNA-binding CsgD family transcriptional regulator